jgi:hypothetical protein
MLCNVEKRVSENIKERRKIYAARDFSNKYDLALFKTFSKKNSGNSLSNLKIYAENWI